MKKFVCGHCGGRIAVTNRHLQKVVVCPECGRGTHPLAGEILAASKDDGPSIQPLSPASRLTPIDRRCENCSREIGRLERLQLWDNHLVCQVCYKQLAEHREGLTLPAIRSEPDDVSTKRAKLQAAIKKLRPWSRALPTSGPSTAVGSTALTKVTRVEPLPTQALRPRSGDTLSVSVARMAGAASSLPPLSIKQRVAVLLCVICLAGVALYGALTLLRDLAGMITTAALILLVITAIVFLLKAGWTYVHMGVSRLRVKPDEKRE